VSHQTALVQPSGLRARSRSARCCSSLRVAIACLHTGRLQHRGLGIFEASGERRQDCNVVAHRGHLREEPFALTGDEIKSTSGAIASCLRAVVSRIQPCCPSPFPNNSGSRAMLRAIRRASSAVSTLACRASGNAARAALMVPAPPASPAPSLLPIAESPPSWGWRGGWKVAPRIKHRAGDVVQLHVSAVSEPIESSARSLSYRGRPSGRSGTPHSPPRFRPRGISPNR
jgi:hypothetical protein